MKTKIIYISGNEVFDVADIRAAFEEVRNALGFGMDTVLFGVPVDADDSVIQIQETSQTVTDNNEVQEPIIPVTEEIISEELPKKKPIRKTKVETSETIEPETIQAVEESEPEEKIIPILSILSSKKEPEINIEQEEVPQIFEPQTFETEQIIINETDLISQVAEEVIRTETVIIEEVMIDDMPVVKQEKTLEQLFERIAPLREDLNSEEYIIEKQTEETNINIDTSLDATLEKLATEFSEKQDNININSKAESSGKIGKLKNILPFKKAKREEPSLMGDLFGWAGIAANDEEFSIPGFFTTSASKK